MRSAVTVETLADVTAALALIGRRVDDVYGSRIGKVADVYVDAHTREPVWLAVRLGRFGDEHVAVPAAAATDGPDGIWIPYERQAVRSSGTVEPREPLTRERELALAAHYGLEAARGEAIRRAPPASVTSVSALAGGQRVQR